MMTEEAADLLRLVAVIIPVGVLVTLMVYIKAASTGQPATNVRRALIWIWGAVLGIAALLGGGRTILGGPVIEIDTLSQSVRVGDMSLLNMALLLVCLVVVVGLWIVAIGHIRRVTAVDADLSEQEEDGDDGVD